MSDYGVAGIGVLGGLMNTAFGADLSYKKQKQLAEYTDQLQREYTRDQYQLRREGLEKAGYNPLLAVDGSAQQAGIQLGSGNVGDGAGMANAISGSINSAVANRQQKEMNDSIMKLQRDQGENLDAQTAKALTDMNNQTKLVNAQVKNIEAQTKLTKTKRTSEKGTVRNFVGRYSKDAYKGLNYSMRFVGENMDW